MSSQNQVSYFENMNEGYMKKHYPEGSVCKAHKKAMKSANAGLGLFFMLAFMAASAAGLFWSINRTLGIIRDEEENMLGMGIGISIFFLLLVVLFAVLAVVIVKGMRKSVDDWIRIIAKAGGCSEQEVRDFDKQAMEPDSLILNHLGKLKSVTTGQKNGILTRDYICLYGGNMPRVMKLSTLTEAYLKDNSYNVNVGNTKKQAHYLTINLANRDKNIAWAETSREAGEALQELLKERCPEIDTARGAIRSE